MRIRSINEGRAAKALGRNLPDGPYDQEDAAAISRHIFDGLYALVNADDDVVDKQTKAKLKKIIQQYRSIDEYLKNVY